MISANHFNGFIFYEGTLGAEWNINEILIPLFVNLESAEERFDYFMQDSMTSHTVKKTIQALRSVFEEFNG
jgi:hypothetical protein